MKQGDETFENFRLDYYSPVAPASGVSPRAQMERVLRRDPSAEAEGMPKSQRVLELNAKHPVFKKLVSANEAGDAEKIKLYAGLLYDQALLVEGILPEDPVAFAASVCELM